MLARSTITGFRMARRQQYAFFSSSTTTTTTTTTTSTPIVELQEFHVQPSQMKLYLETTKNAIPAFVPLRFVSTPDTGGDLFVATHAYYYQGGHEERNVTREKLEQLPEWAEYMDQYVLPSVTRVQSNIFVEAPLVAQFDAVPGLATVPTVNDKDNNHNNNHKGILELRRYKLQLGYDTVPKFLEFYQEGLPSKLTAPGTDPTTSLVTLLYSDVGRLNEVIEIWRHGNGTGAMETSRKAARKAAEWRTAIAKIATLAVEFTSTIHKPTSFSPLR